MALPFNQIRDGKGVFPEGLLDTYLVNCAKDVSSQPDSDKLLQFGNVKPTGLNVSPEHMASAIVRVTYSVADLTASP